MTSNDRYCRETVLSDGSDTKCRVTTQGGKNIIAEFTPTSDSNCTRSYNDKSEANISIVVNSNNYKCCEDLGAIIPLKCELEWWRDGMLIWAGPISSINWTKSNVQIMADDVSLWWQQRKLGSHKIKKETTELFKLLYDDIMEEDPIPGINIIYNPTNKYMTLEVFRQEHTTMAEILPDIVAVGLDYTIIGRNIIVGDADFFVGNNGYIVTSGSTPFKLSDSDLVNTPVISAIGPGNGFATRVLASGKSEKFITLTAPDDVIEKYGLVETFIEFPHIVTTSDLMNAATSYLIRHSNPYMVNQGQDAVLKPGAPIPYKALIPGLPILVESIATCKKMRVLMRLSKVTTYGDGKVNIGLEPMGEILESELTGSALQAR